MRSLLILFLFSTLAVAQQDGGTGTVSGQVSCVDTQHPARLAHVALVPLPATVTSSSLEVTGDITGLTITIPDKRAEAAQPTRPSR